MTYTIKFPCLKRINNFVSFHLTFPFRYICG
jgi:hypothetical protein